MIKKSVNKNNLAYKDNNLNYYRIILVLLFIVLTPVLTFAQNNRINLSVTNATLKATFAEIEKQTAYRFSYRDTDIDNKADVTIEVSNITINDLLSQILPPKNLQFSILSNKVMVTPLPIAGQRNRMPVTGTVLDDQGEPVIGANIMIKGTATGTITDIDGIFRLEASPDAVLVITYLGFEKKEVAIKGESFLSIVLKADWQDLDEVVVIGYGTNTKRNLTTSISTVDADKMKNLPIASITDGLAGRAAGLIVTQSGGGIGKKSKVFIRGGETKLVVIDGIISPYEDFENLNPNDVESMTILKDAAAAAVYGARAGEGVIVIQTKGGLQGLQVEYSFNQSWSEPTFLAKKLNSYERAKLDNDIRDIYNLEHRWTDEQVRKFRDGSDPYLYPNIDWQKLVLRNFAPESKHSLALRGGSEINKYFISFQAYDQESMYRENTNWLKRYNVRMSETSDFKKIGLKLHFGLDGYITNQRSPQSIYGNSYYHTWGHTQNKSPMDLAYNEYGQFTDYGDHPLVEISPESGYIKTDTKMINGLFNAEWQVPGVSGLKLKAGGNYRFLTSQQKLWNKTAQQYSLDGIPAAQRQMTLEYKNNDGRQYTIQTFADYERSFLNTHHVSATVGFEQSYGFNTEATLKRRDFQFPIDQMGVGPSSTMENSANEKEWGRAGLVARVTYDYKRKYYIEGSLRHDGSDLFPKEKRWGTFFAGSAGYVISEESFFESLNDKNILNFFKLRASYGEVGLDSGIDPFSYLSSYKMDERQYVLDGQLLTVFNEGNLVSTDITWYTRNTMDLGFDFATLENRLSGSFDYFYMRTKGYLTSPSEVGYSDPLGMSLPKVKSDGEHRRHGYEVAIAWRDRIGDITYEVGGNFTYFDQLVAVAWDEDITSQKNPYRRQLQKKGYLKNDGLLSHGYYINADDIMNSPYREGSYNVVAGDIKYQDLNGDGLIDGNDRTYIGKNGMPRGNYGIFGSASWKGFFGNILFQGATSRDMYLEDVMRSGPGGYMITYPFQLDYWTADNVNATYPRPMINSSENGNHNYDTSDFWLVNGRYFRLKSLQVGHNLKKTLLSDVKWLQKFEVVLSGQNLFTISPATKYGFDPETGNTNNYDYPVQRVYSISFNVGF